MAQSTNARPGPHRIVPLVAVGALATASAAAFAGVFTGPATTLRLGTAAILSVALAVALQRRSLWLSASVSAGCLLLLLGPLVFPSTSAGGLLPTGRTIDALLSALREVGEQARTQVAPTTATGPLLLAAVAAVWTAGFSAHALFVRAGSPLLAAFPPLALFGFAETVLGPGRRIGSALAMLTAILGALWAERFLTVDALARSGRRRVRTAQVTSGLRLGVAVGAFAVVVPLLMPVASRGPGGLIPLPEASVNPFISIQSSLTQERPTELFRVEADRAAYWRLLGLDAFDGTDWSTGAPDATPGRPISGFAPSLPGGLERGLRDGEPLHQRFTILGLRSPWIPVAYRPTELALAVPELRYDERLGTLSIPNGLEEDMTYSVESVAAFPTPEDLDAVADVSERPELMPSEDVYTRATQLPVTFPSEVGTLATRIADGEPNAYRKMIAIQDYLRDGFGYDQDVQIPAGADPILYFLNVSRRGFCQQFAGTMAAMARSLGYPARVAVGFLPGSREAADGPLTVTTKDAHAWPEVWFPRYGWIAFEPTPTRENPLAQPYVDPAPYRAPGDRQAASSAGQDRDLRSPPGSRPLRHDLGDDPLPVGSSGRGWDSGPGRIIVLIGLLVLAAVILPPVKSLARWVRRRRRHRKRRRKRPGASGSVLITFDAFEERAGDLGFGRRTGETLREYAARLESSGGAKGPTTEAAEQLHFGRLADIVTRSAYSPEGIGTPEAEQAAEDAVAAVRTMRRRAGLSRRIAAAYRPERETGARRPSPRS